MILRRSALAFAALCAAALQCVPSHAGNWPLGRYDSACTGFTSEAIKLPLVHTWQFNTGRSGRNSSTPVIAKGVVYFAAGDRVIALDAESGSVKWRFPADQPLSGTVRASLAVNDDTLFVALTDRSLYAVNIADGKLRWSYATGGVLRSSPVLSGNAVYFGSDDNSLYALDSATGDLLWRGPYLTKDDVASPPAAASGALIFASSDGILYSASPISGSGRWSYRLPGVPTRSAPVISAETVLIAASSTLYCIGLKTSNLRWSTPFASDIAAGPTVAENVGSTDSSLATGTRTIFVVTRDRKLFAITPGGKAKWKAAVALPYACSTAPTVMGDTVVVGTDRGTVCAYSVATGDLKWSYFCLPSQIGSSGTYTAVTAPVSMAEGRLYVVTDDGALHCFEPGETDQTAPQVYELQPARMAAMSGSPPIKISASVFDFGSGIDASKIELALDGKPVEYLYDLSTSTVSYSTPVGSERLADGRHEITLKASDWSNNQVTQTWSFVADNSLRPPALPKAAAGKTTSTPTTTPDDTQVAPPDNAAPSNTGRGFYRGGGGRSRGRGRGTNDGYGGGVQTPEVIPPPPPDSTEPPPGP